MTLSSLFHGSISASACTSASFHYPEILGADFLSLETTLVSNYSGFISNHGYISHQDVNLENVSFCNVTVSYARLGQNNNIHNQVWLPLDHWNGRMQGIGGGGFSAGLDAQNLGLYGSVGEGYASVRTDAGLTGEGGFASPFDPSPWAQTSPGNVNLYALHNFGSVALNDAAIIGKSITKDFYGQPPTYSYWTGCSGGGRQGMMLAQRYPDAYNGIVAAAPAINWPQFFVAMYWPRFVMDKLGVYPHPCELEIIRDQAVAACDGDDGVIDLLITRPELCKFDPNTLVGRSFNCTSTGKKWKVSAAAATIAQKVWKGPEKTDKSPLWYGMDPSTALSGGSALAHTECTDDGVCTLKTIPLPIDWVKLFILKDPRANLTALTQTDYENILKDSVEEYSSFLATNNPDLAEFRDKGGKLVSWHRTIGASFLDELIAAGGSTDYYEKVTALDSEVHDYFRLFLAPRLGHCYGGDGVYPDTAFAAVVAWVEEGIAPETLNATSQSSRRGSPISQQLCAYPKKLTYRKNCKGGAEKCFHCK